MRAATRLLSYTCEESLPGQFRQEQSASRNELLSLIGSTQFEIVMAAYNLHKLPFKMGPMSRHEIKQLIIQIRQANAFRKECLAGLSQGIAAKSGFAIGLNKHGLLKSPKGLMSAVLHASRSMKQAKKPTLERCQKVAATLKLDEPIKETVCVYAKAKKSGGHRPIVVFGLRHRTAQAAVNAVLGAYHHPRPFQLTSRGVPTAIKTAQEAIVSGLTYAAEVDICDFFGSFTLEKLATELPLPKGVVEHAVVGRHIEHEAYQGRGPHGPHTLPTHSGLIEQARLGIPQGSACSSLVAAYCVARLDWPSASDVVLLNYADNFFLFAPSQVRLEEAIEALTKAVSKLPGGTFKSKVKQKTSIIKPFVMLGHEFQINNDELTTNVSEANGINFVSELSKIEEPLSYLIYNLKYPQQKGKALKILARFYAFGLGWLDYFKQCNNIKFYQNEWWANLIEHAYHVELTLNEITEAVEPYMLFEPEDYDFSV